MSHYPEDLKHILFLDIETASVVREFHDLPARMQSEWEKKANRFAKLDEYPLGEEEISSFYTDKAAIYAEFSRVVCISMGILTKSDDGKWQIRIKTLADKDEKVLLEQFAELLTHYYPDPDKHCLCGHNIREFDVPFLCRRFLVNRLNLPVLMDIAGRRPWQLHFLLDTLDLWKFGDYKHYTSLDLLCAIFDIASPKGGLRGDQVSEAFWEGRINEITSYCEKDLVATVQVFLRLQNLHDVYESLFGLTSGEEE